ncbi:HlyU family transcriptional regulator [Salipiger sp. P9]|uniref:HlyU family transcriptional regulator n=1 Tax=Salipiger pentaromativorans TaxID=2943193 RepID=UPI0021579F7A|nr:HlyU family transcriptional regulator [Salipiger pentaromativorans]MCR8546791.1 HlyU family transcriptional regulator [Salipiger pentaromativorans]
MSLLSRLFGGGAKDAAAPKPSADSVDYKGFRITPEPIATDGQFRIAALIEAEMAGEAKSHQLIRADLLRDREEAVAASLRKARQLIDEQGPRLFG